jgi:hypothetical protein
MDNNDNQGNKQNDDGKVDSDASELIYAWTSMDEDLLCKWAENAQCYEFLHNDSASVYEWWLNRLNFLQLSLSAVGTLSVMQNQFTDIDIRNNFGIGLGIISALVTTIQYINSKYKVTENHIKYLEHAKDWIKLKSDIEVELSRSRTERTEKKILIHTFRKIHNELVEKQLRPLDSAIMKFIKMHGDTDIRKPSILNSFTKIIVNTSVSEPILLNSAEKTKETIIELFKQQKGRDPTSEELDDIQLTEHIQKQLLNKNLPKGTPKDAMPTFGV